MVVTSHDPKRVNFSENTSIHECLVIGRRNEDNEKPTRFIQLTAYPNNIKQAEELIDKIQSSEAGELFTETLWTADKMRAGDWTPVQWFNSNLVTAAEEIDSLPLLAMSDQICVWDFRQRGLPIFFDKTLSENGNAFCTINKDVMQTINAKPETLATPKNGYEKEAANLWSKASSVLVASRFSTTTTRLTAIYLRKTRFRRSICSDGCEKC